MSYTNTNPTKYTEEERNQIVAQYMPQIKIWAQRAKSTLPPYVDIDDIYSAAALGFIECLNNFDKSRNISFSAYVEHRVKGAILDTLRSLDFLSRGARTKVKNLDAVKQELSQKLGRLPDVEEIAEYSNMDEEEIHEIAALQSSNNFVSLDETIGEDETTLVEYIRSDILTPEEDYMKNQALEVLAQEIDKLSGKERLVVSLYYYEELTMKEVAKVLDISESRVSQLHAATMQKMKKRLKNLI